MRLRCLAQLTHSLSGQDGSGKSCLAQREALHWPPPRSAIRSSHNTLQGIKANEPRPAIHRNIFQAYATGIAPVGRGLGVDRGKFASSPGFETNYAKDQMNYSRSYFFNFLPFYPMGLRSTHPVTSKISATYWLVNGANQTENCNGFKSQAVILNFNPSSSVSGNVNDYAGRESPGGRSGRFHVIDTYWNWNLNQ